MRTGARTFAGFAGVIVPVAVVFFLVTGLKLGGIGMLVGLFLLLKFCNQLDRRDIRDGR